MINILKSININTTELNLKEQELINLNGIQQYKQITYLCVSNNKISQIDNIGIFKNLIEV